MTLKHRIKLLFSGISKKLNPEKVKIDKKPAKLVEYRDMSKDDSILMFLEKELLRLKRIKEGYIDKSNEVAAYNLIIKERVDTINWIIDNIYGKEQRSTNGSTL